MTEFEKIVIITQKTWLDELVEKFSSKDQAQFYIEQSGGSFAVYLLQHTNYYTALALLKRSLPLHIRYQVIDKDFLPNFLFGPNDLVIVLGRDGLIINTAKYLRNQVILGINPDPTFVEGVLLPFSIDDAKEEINNILEGNAAQASITIAQASLNDGQTLLGVNDIFVGHQSHQSARYTLRFDGQEENQSSSGIIISTGVGSTGWFKSVITGSMYISNGYLEEDWDFNCDEVRFPWDAQYLYYCVREPWVSKNTGSSLTFGKIEPGKPLVIESSMAAGGVIFSDGLEQDRLHFNAGSIATISLAQKQVSIYTKS